MKRTRLAVVLLTGALAAMTPQWAQAVGTASGTAISNKATINYKVATVPQTLIESSQAGNSTPGLGQGIATTFVVDDKVNIVMTSENAGFVTTYPGSSAVALKFTVTNTGNTVHDFALISIPGVGNDFVATSIKYYSDDGGTVDSYDGTDTEITFINNLVLDTPIVVFLVAGIPLTAINGAEASYALKATATDDSAGALVATAGVDTAVVDIVLADIDSDGAAGANDTTYNGIYIKWAGNNLASTDPGFGYKVSAAALTVSKTSAVYRDPINFLVNPKAIPGAIVTYTITITNTAGATATDVSISDSLAGVSGQLTFNTQFNDGTNTCVADRGIVVANVCQTNAVGGPDDDADFTVNVVNAKVSSLAPGASTEIKFQVTIQ